MSSEEEIRARIERTKKDIKDGKYAGQAVVSGPETSGQEENPLKTYRVEKTKQETEPVIIFTKEQLKKRQKARDAIDKKSGKFSFLSHKDAKEIELAFTVTTRHATIKDIIKTESSIEVMLNPCIICNTPLESIGISQVPIEDWLDDITRPYRIPGYQLTDDDKRVSRNLIKSWGISKNDGKRFCSGCGLEVMGSIELNPVENIIEKTKLERFNDKLEHENFAGVIIFTDFNIRGGQFPKTRLYLGKRRPISYGYICGTCGNEGFAIELQRKLKKLLSSVQDAWNKGTDIIETETISAEYRCPKCGNELKTTGTVEVRFPEGRKELMQAFQVWQRDAFRLVFEREKVPTRLDFAEAFDEATAKEREKTEED